MDKMEQKNIWRRLESARVRENRIITGYIQHMHPEVYREAADFYAELNELYPNKKDLRKTNEYEWIKTGSGTKQKKFYTRRKQYQKKKKDSHRITDNMNLCIPLMNRVETATETRETTTETPETATETPETATETPETATETPETATETPETATETPIDMSMCEEIHVDIEPAEFTFPAITDEMLEGLIKDLREDPDLDQIFDELDIEFEEESPLERELLYW